MAVELAWLHSNILDVVGVTPGVADVQTAAGALQRELIEFDSESTTNAGFRMDLEGAPESTGLSNFVDIDWPDGLAPTPVTPPAASSSRWSAAAWPAMSPEAARSQMRFCRSCRPSSPSRARQ
jgi:hypothetical protein